MPIILANSHSHEFSYVSADGIHHTVKVQRGEAIPANVPVEVITDLVAETVVGWNGETTVPRYQRVDAVDGQTHRSGVVSTRRQVQDLSNQSASTAKSADEIQALLDAAAEEEEREVQQRIDEEAAANAAADQLAREAADTTGFVEIPEVPVVDEREALLAEAKELGLKLHPATGVEKIRKALDEAKSGD